MRATMLVAAAVLGASACASFDDPSTVMDLRVLAVRSEPTEIILNAAAPEEVAAAEIPDIVITPLVADPAGGGRPLTITVSACANDPAAAPPPSNGTDPTGFPSGGARTTVGSALCDGAPTELPIAADVDLGAQPSVTAHLPAAWVAQAFLRDKFKGTDGRIYGGTELGMPVVFQVTARTDDGALVVKAIKRVTFWMRPVRDDQVPNASPLVASVRAFDRRDETTAEPVPDAIVPLQEGMPLDVPDDGLWIEPAAADAQAYVTAVIDRLTGDVVPHDIPAEVIRYDFYATAGTFSPFETSSEPAPGVEVSTRVHIESKYKPPPMAERPVGEPLLVDMWIVARDERGGASWVTRTLSVKGRP